MEQKAQNKKSYDILIVEDEEKNLRLLKKTLKSADEFDCNITTAGDGKEGLKYIKENHYDIVLSDYQMPKMNGVDFLNRVNEKYPSDTVKFLITGHGNMKVIKKAINEAEIHQFIEKPWKSDELRSIINEVMELREEREKEETADMSDVPDVNDVPEASDVSGVSDVEGALKTIKDFQKKLIENSSLEVKKEKLLFEFESSSEFNNFSFNVKNLKNVTIKKVERDESKYIVTIELYPKPINKIS